MSRRQPVRRVKDPGDPNPVVGWVTVTGHECPVCHLPMVPYVRSPGYHPTCSPPLSDDRGGGQCRRLSAAPTHATVANLM